jgi:putative AlgH/UPF0301 family transcriptional regulator
MKQAWHPLFLGYTGWEEQQLESEMNENSWFCQTAIK